MKRTHTCSELTGKDINKKVILCGWCSTRRDHGGVIFIDLRDRYGITQIVFDPSHNMEPHKTAEHLGREDVVQVSGIVKQRKKGMENPKMKTGAIEVFVEKIEILNEAETPPMEIDDRISTNEDTRLRYRYLDLRKPAMQHNIMVRHKAAKAARDYFDSLDFLEIETPILTKSTPEGARDYLVPSRIHPGKFYALPQSPQIFKQLLMVSGFDRYFQIAKCFRDEDLRADRQPEFTQIDVEMSFVDENDVMEVMEGMIKHIWRSVLNKDIKTPFPRLTYEEAISKYGVDKPDTRFGLQLVDVTEIVSNSNFEVFTKAIRQNGIVKCINAKSCASFSRTIIEELTAFVGIYGSKGLAWMKVTDKGLESSIVKFFSDKIQKEIMKAADAKKDDLLLFVGDSNHEVVNEALGNLRAELAKRLKFIDNSHFSFVWIVDFPFFKKDEYENWTFTHNPFSAPKPQHMEWLLRKENIGDILTTQYDIVLNGTEIGGGSIRNHKPEALQSVFEIMGYSKDEIKEKFGHVIESFSYGAPPHGGIAFGFDRLVAMMTSNESIREVIAFPKNKSAESMMEYAPSEATEKQLQELHIKLDFVKEPANVVFGKIRDVLNMEKIEYEVLEHKPVFTSKDAAEVRGTELKQGTKALVLKTEEGFIQACVAGNKELDIEKLQKITLFQKIEMANAREVRQVTGCNIGSVPPFGNLFGLKVYFDKSVVENDVVAFNVGQHTKSIKMKANDLVRVVNPVVGEFGK
ncbi:aspartate--tRNA ligase [Candidatus Woesearchaeota archaeon]|nr:aspartate--tRNA ligase [Candidatus Woesearchaeota archaeon]